MGQVLHISEPALDMMMYGDQSAFLGQYLQQQMQQLGPVFNEFSSRLLNAVKTSYDFINDKLVQYGIKNELTNSGLNVLGNQYLELLSWMALQQANPTMERIIMAHPEVKQLYVDQNIDGYSDSYVPIDPEGVGKEDYSYRRIMSGVLIDDIVSHYFDEMVPGDKELSHYEKDIALNTFSTIDWLLANCDFDFTNKSKRPKKINRS